jgi:uncharacterized damage-inducible protein DinB
MRAMKRLVLVLLVVLVPSLVFGAQNTPRASAPAAIPTPAPKAGFRADFFANLDEVEEKILALAEATPQEKFAWRPANGIRSVSEVYMHVAGGNYFLATFIGAKAPARNGDMEKTVTAKADVIAELKASFQHLRNAVNALSDADLEKTVKMFGKQTSYRSVLLTMISHLHEHLGQSIAYARSNGVVPPWSQ